MDVLEDERLDVADRRLALAGERPHRRVTELVVVALGFTVGGLVFLAEVAAARLVTLQRVARQGSSVMASPSLKLRMWSWQLVVPRRGP